MSTSEYQEQIYVRYIVKDNIKNKKYSADQIANVIQNMSAKDLSDLKKTLKGIL